MIRHPVIEEDLKRIVSSDLPWRRLFGKTVLITGANGFVPAYMFETLLFLNEAKGAQIHVVALLRNGEKAVRRFGDLSACSDVTTVVQDVRDPYGGPPEVDFLVHAASQASPKYFGRDPVGTFEANVLGTQRMLGVVKHANSEAFLFVSSGEVYGQLQDPAVPVKETSFGWLDPLDLRSSYAEGKRAGEALCTCWHKQFGIPTKIARLSHTYGPGMDLEDGRVFADFVADIVARRNIVMKSDGSARRPFCYLADTTIALFTVLLLGQSGEAYNVGGESEVSIKELAEMLTGLFPDRQCKLVQESRTADDPYVAKPASAGHFDLSKIRSLGWQPTTPLEEGFLRTILSYEA